MELKRTKVHRLPTEGLSSITKGKGEYSHIFHFNPEDEYVEDEDEYPIHLYFTSDEEIKKGDSYLTDNRMVLRADKLLLGLVYAKGDHGRQVRHCRKIIATTDPKLETTDEVFHNTYKNTYKQKLPQPTQDFIKAYCEQGGIDEVDVECDVMDISTLTSNTDDYPNLDIVTIKVDPIHNTVITHLIEEKMIPLSKLEDCVLDVVYKMMFRANAFPQEQKDKSKEFCKEWIKENL